ncbi:MAG: hypothetical protein NWE99_10855 [Candidatus Bathyarchaeota archaeon]|nr:hypothetical protein [Candidatus Bathyarchaeota archaeon]
MFRKHRADYFEIVDILAYDLHLKSEVVEFAKDILRLGRIKLVTAGRNPRGLAAAALYIACIVFGVYVIQRDLARFAGVEEVTVRNNYKMLCRRLGLEINVADHLRFGRGA